MDGSLIVNLDVPDIENAQRFYCEGLGLRLKTVWDKDFVELEGWGCRFCLLRKASGSRGAGEQPRSYQRHWTPLHIDLPVKDIVAAKQRVLDAGGVLESDIREQSYGKIAMFADPFGHGFCLIEFKAGGYQNLPGYEG